MFLFTFFHKIIRDGNAVPFILVDPPQASALVERSDTNRGSHFASKAMGARSREPRAKIFAKDETPLVIKPFNR